MKLTKEFQIINLIIFSVAILYFNFTVNFNYGDDVGLRSQILNLNTLVQLYLNWSGRVLDRVLLIFMAHNPEVFRIANSLIMIAMPVVTWLLVDIDRKLSNLTLLVMLFLFYDYKEMRTAGFIATYITYYWSLFANILFFIVIRRCLAADKLLSMDLVYAVLLGIFVCNSEIGACFNTVILLAIFAARYRSRAIIDWKVLILLLISVLSIIFFLTCPGLHKRSFIETFHWLPEFSSYSTVYKLYLGFSETLLYYFSTGKVILVLFLSALLVSAVNRGVNVAYFILVCLAGFVLPVYSKNLIIKFSNVSNIDAYIFFAVLLCFAFFVLLMICRIFKDSAGMLLVFVLTLGFLTRVMMGFSPTLYASSTRTYMYCDFTILIAAYYIMKESKTDISELCPVFLALFAYPYFIGNLITR